MKSVSSLVLKKKSHYYSLRFSSKSAASKVSAKVILFYEKRRLKRLIPAFLIELKLPTDDVTEHKELIHLR